MRIITGRATAIVGSLLIATTATLMVFLAQHAAGQVNDGPTRENALQMEKELAHAMRVNDGDAFCRLLAPEWAVVNGNGGLEDEPGKGESICAAIKAGIFIRTREPLNKSAHGIAVG